MSRPVLPKEHRPGSVAELLAIAFPMVVSSACETLMMFVDRLFLSRLGSEYMSAAMGGGMTCFMFMTFFIGLTGYASPLVAQHLGAGQKARCPVAVGQSFFIALLAYPLILACLPAGHWLFRISGTPSEQLPHQTVYFNILVFGSILGLVRNCFSSFFSGIGRTRVIMLSAIVSMVANIAANYVLIFGHFGFPRMGMAGAGYGTLFGSAVGMVFLVVAYLRRSYRQEFATPASFRFDWPMMRKLLRLGTPSGLEFFLNMVAFNLLVLNFHSYGVAQAAAVTIAFNWDMVAFIPLIGTFFLLGKLESLPFCASFSCFHAAFRPSLPVLLGPETRLPGHQRQNHQSHHASPKNQAIHRHRVPERGRWHLLLPLPSQRPAEGG